jgi:hypothetical protein
MGRQEACVEESGVKKNLIIVSYQKRPKQCSNSFAKILLIQWQGGWRGLIEENVARRRSTSKKS